MNLRTAVVAVIAAALTAPLAHAEDAEADAQKIPKDFYEAKKVAVTQDGWRRAERNLADVAVGMGETRFFEAMKMAVLAHAGKPVDVRMDGYLAEASARANKDARRSERWLVFGWKDADSELPAVRVLLVDHRVSEVRHEPRSVASATDSVAVTASVN